MTTTRKKGVIPQELADVLNAGSPVKAVIIPLTAEPNAAETDIQSVQKFFQGLDSEKVKHLFTMAGGLERLHGLLEDLEMFILEEKCRTVPEEDVYDHLKTVKYVKQLLRPTPFMEEIFTGDMPPIIVEDIRFLAAKSV